MNETVMSRHVMSRKAHGEWRHHENMRNSITHRSNVSVAHSQDFIFCTREVPREQVRTQTQDGRVARHIRISSLGRGGCEGKAEGSHDKSGFRPLNTGVAKKTCAQPRSSKDGLTREVCDNVLNRTVTNFLLVDQQLEPIERCACNVMVLTRQDGKEKHADSLEINE